jgi:hypothetical protein
VGFSITDQLLKTFFFIHQVLEKEWEYNEADISREPMIQLGGTYCTIFSCSFAYPRSGNTKLEYP